MTAALADVHERLEPYYSEIGRPSGSIAAGPAKAAELRRGGEWKTTPSTMRQSTCGRWRWSSLQLAIRWSELSVSKAPANEKPQPEGAGAKFLHVHIREREPEEYSRTCYLGRSLSLRQRSELPSSHAFT